MDKSVFKASEIRYLWKHRGSKNYELKCLKTSGNFITNIIFEDVRSGLEVSGKFVASPAEGEAYHWPRLRHENLAPLFDVVSISENLSVYMSTVFQKSLRDIIHEDEFLRAPNCFTRKKSYAEDVLWGLDYLHGKRLCLMNLNEANIYINNVADKAIITDFSSLTLAERARKCNVNVSLLYRAPELNDESSECFDAIAAEMWAYGAMMLQIFTGHSIPELCGSGDVLSTVTNLHLGNLVKANKGAFITSNTFIVFQKFLYLFLNPDPLQRSTAKSGAISPFLQKSWRGLGKLWQYYSPHLPKPETNIGTSYPSPRERHNENIFYETSKSALSCSVSSEIAKYKENLRIHFPWNKFINLDYVSNETDNGEKVAPSRSYKQSSRISNKNQTIDTQEKQAAALDMEDFLRNDRTPASATCLSFENMNNASDSARHNSLLEMDTEVEKRNIISDYLIKNSTPRPNNLLSPIKNNKSSQTKVSSHNDINEGISNDGNSLNYSPTITSSESPSITYNKFLTTDSFSSPSDFSTGDSIGYFRDDAKWNNIDLSNNLLLDGEKSNTEAEETDRYLDVEDSINNFPVELDWIKAGNDRHALELIDLMKDWNVKNNSLPGSGVNIFHERDYNKSSTAEFQRSSSDSTIHSLTPQISCHRSDPCINSNRSHVANRSWKSNITITSDDCNIFLNDLRLSTTIAKLPILNTDKKYRNGGYGPDDLLLLLDCPTSFENVMSVQSDGLHEVRNFKEGTSFKENIFGSFKNKLSLPEKSTIYSRTSIKNKSLPHHRSETSLEVRKSMDITNYRSETCLDVQNLPLPNQAGDSMRDLNMFDHNILKSDSQRIFESGENYNGYFSGTNFSKVGDADVIKSFPFGKEDTLNFDRRPLYTCAMIRSLDLQDSKDVSETDGSFSIKSVYSSSETTGTQPNPYFLGYMATEQHEKNDKKIINEEGLQLIHPGKDFPSEYDDVPTEQTREDLSKNEWNAGQNEHIINETQGESSNFTKVPLRSTDDDGKPKPKKRSKKEYRKKSWFHRLCPGCKVYSDDKEELFERSTK